MVTGGAPPGPPAVVTIAAAPGEAAVTLLEMFDMEAPVEVGPSRARPHAGAKSARRASATPAKTGRFGAADGPRPGPPGRAADASHPAASMLYCSA